MISGANVIPLLERLRNSELTIEWRDCVVLHVLGLKGMFVVLDNRGLLQIVSMVAPDGLFLASFRGGYSKLSNPTLDESPNVSLVVSIILPF